MLNKIIVLAIIFFSLSSAVSAQEKTGCCSEFEKETNVLIKTETITEKRCEELETNGDYEKTDWDGNKRALGNKCEPWPNTSPVKSGEQIEFTPQVSIPESEFTAGAKVKLAESTKPLADYIIAIFKYSIGVIGIISAIVLMFGGVRWLTAGGNSSAITEAKTYIISSLSGLILTFGSFLLLSTINTNLTDIQIAPVNRIEYVGLTTGCCLKTDQNGNTTARTQSGDACDIAKKDISDTGYKSVDFFEGQEAEDNKCVEVKGCCQVTMKVTGVNLNSKNVKNEKECKFGAFDVTLPGGELVSAATTNFTFMRDYQQGEGTNSNTCVKASQNAQQETGCINTNQEGCNQSSDCCSGLKCARGGDPYKTTCVAKIPSWYYGCLVPTDCVDNHRCENYSGDGLKCVPNNP